MNLGRKPDLEDGKEKLDRLCPDCYIRLERNITQEDIRIAITPDNIRKLRLKMRSLVCDECAQTLWQGGPL